jgi:tetratricopeptide (TPR) repeat protein
VNAFCEAQPIIKLTAFQKRLQRSEQADGSGRLSRAFWVELQSKLKVTSQELSALLDGQGPRAVAPLSDEESLASERVFSQLQVGGLHDESSKLAASCVERAREAKNPLLIARWCKHLADAARTSGDLRVARDQYSAAVDAIQPLRLSSPNDLDLIVLDGSIRFGRIIVEQYLIRADFKAAATAYNALQKETEAHLRSLQKGPKLAVSARKLAIGILHLKRQQAEMVRYSGRYAEACTRSASVIAEYPESMPEERWWGRLGEADALRLRDGRHGDEAEKRLNQLLNEARYVSERAEGRIGSALLRLARIYQRQGKDDSMEAALDEAEQIVLNRPNIYRLVHLYALLQRATLPGATPDTSKRLLRQAIADEGLGLDYATLEYGHVMLIEGELDRRRKPALAREAFEKALTAYRRTGSPWGIVRATIGLRLSATMPGQSKRASANFDSSKLEGVDRELWNQFSDGDSIPSGRLWEDLP